MRALAVLWTVLVVVGLLAPTASLPDLGVATTPDKLIHGALFTALGALWTLAFPDHVRAIVAAGLAFAVATEVGQGVLPVGRSPDLLDGLADVVGLALGVGVARWIAARRPAG